MGVCCCGGEGAGSGMSSYRTGVQLACRSALMPYTLNVSVSKTGNYYWCGPSSTSGGPDGDTTTACPDGMHDNFWTYAHLGTTTLTHISQVPAWNDGTCSSVYLGNCVEMQRWTSPGFNIACSQTTPNRFSRMVFSASDAGNCLSLLGLARVGSRSTGNCGCSSALASYSEFFQDSTKCNSCLKDDGTAATWCYEACFGSFGGITISYNLVSLDPYHLQITYRCCQDCCRPNGLATFRNLDQELLFDITE